METKQIIGLLGSAVLFVGVFAPVISIPIVGSQNYFQNGEGDGIIIMVLSVLSFVTVLSNRYKFLLPISATSLVVLGYTFINVRSKITELESQLTRDLEGNPFSFIGDMAMQSIQIQWGFAVLIVGSIFLLTSAYLHDISLKANTLHEDCNHEGQRENYCTQCGEQLSGVCKHEGQTGSFCTQCGHQLKTD